MTRSLVLAGGSGFLGTLLGQWFTKRGWSVSSLSRAARPGSIQWDGRTLGPWCDVLEGASVLINLSGRSVNCRYHTRNRREMLASRVESTRVLGQAIQLCRRAPHLWINASTATLYRHSYDQPMDEMSGVIGATAEAKDAFSIEVARAWEETFEAAATPGPAFGGWIQI